MRPEHWIYTLPLRLRSLFRRPQADQDLDEKIRDHLERRTADFVAKDLSPDEARYAAQREFGGIGQSKEKRRDTRKVNWIYDLAQDVHYTLRQLRKNSGFAALAILTLALGIGANTAMFTVIDSVLLRPMPLRDGDRLVDVEAVFGPYFQAISWLDYLTIRDQCRLLEDVAGYAEDSALIQAGEGGQKVMTERITANLFDLLGVRPALGRPFLRSDIEPGSPAVAILSDPLWRGYFGADPKILGRQIRAANVAYTIVGVMPKGLRFPPSSGPDGGLVIWLPLKPSPAMLKDRVEEAMALVGF